MRDVLDGVCSRSAWKAAGQTGTDATLRRRDFGADLRHKIDLRGAVGGPVERSQPRFSSCFAMVRCATSAPRSGLCSVPCQLAELVAPLADHDDVLDRLPPEQLITAERSAASGRATREDTAPCSSARDHRDRVAGSLPASSSTADGRRRPSTRAIGIGFRSTRSGRAESGTDPDVNGSPAIRTVFASGADDTLPGSASSERARRYIRRSGDGRGASPGVGLAHSLRYPVGSLRVAPARLRPDTWKRWCPARPLKPPPHQALTELPSRTR